MHWEKAEEFWRNNRKKNDRGIGFVIAAGYARLYGGEFVVTEVPDETSYNQKGLKAVVSFQYGGRIGDDNAG